MTERHATGLETARTTVSPNLAEHPGKTVFHLSGRDTVGMLEAILTNKVPRTDGLGVYALLLDAKGRIQTDLRVVKRGEEVLIVTEDEGADAARAILGRYAPFSRVKLDEPGSKLLGLYGDGAKELLGLSLSEHESEEVEIDGFTILAVGVETPLSGYDLILPEESLDLVRNRLLERGASPVSPGHHETARVNAGIPRFGSDMTPENFPGETGVLDRAVSFQKGCYPGQETVARMHYRGQPNKRLHRFTVEGKPPEPGTPILQNDEEVGWITSAAPLPINQQNFALGYLKRKADPTGELRAANSSLTNAHPC